MIMSKCYQNKLLQITLNLLLQLIVLSIFIRFDILIIALLIVINKYYIVNNSTYRSKV